MKRIYLLIDVSLLRGQEAGVHLEQLTTSIARIAATYPDLKTTWGYTLIDRECNDQMLDAKILTLAKMLQIASIFNHRTAIDLQTSKLPLFLQLLAAYAEQETANQTATRRSSRGDCRISPIEALDKALVGALASSFLTNLIQIDVDVAQDKDNNNGATPAAPSGLLSIFTPALGSHEGLRSFLGDARDAPVTKTSIEWNIAKKLKGDLWIQCARRRLSVAWFSAEQATDPAPLPLALEVLANMLKTHCQLASVVSFHDACESAMTPIDFKKLLDIKTKDDGDNDTDVSTSGALPGGSLEQVVAQLVALLGQNGNTNDIDKLKEAVKQRKKEILAKKKIKDGLVSRTAAAEKSRGDVENKATGIAATKPQRTSTKGRTVVNLLQNGAANASNAKTVGDEEEVPGRGLSGSLLQQQQNLMKHQPSPSPQNQPTSPPLSQPKADCSAVIPHDPSQAAALLKDRVAELVVVFTQKWAENKKAAGPELARCISSAVSTAFLSIECHQVVEAAAKKQRVRVNKEDEDEDEDAGPRQTDHRKFLATNAVLTSRDLRQQFKLTKGEEAASIFSLLCSSQVLLCFTIFGYNMPAAKLSVAVFKEVEAIMQMVTASTHPIPQATQEFFNNVIKVHFGKRFAPDLKRLANDLWEEDAEPDFAAMFASARGTTTVATVATGMKHHQQQQQPTASTRAAAPTAATASAPDTAAAAGLCEATGESPGLGNLNYAEADSCDPSSMSGDGTTRELGHATVGHYSNGKLAALGGGNNNAGGGGGGPSTSALSGENSGVTRGTTVLGGGSRGAATNNNRAVTSKGQIAKPLHHLQHLKQRHNTMNQYKMQVPSAQQAKVMLQKLKGKGTASMGQQAGATSRGTAMVAKGKAQAAAAAQAAANGNGQQTNNKPGQTKQKQQGPPLPHSKSNTAAAVAVVKPSKSAPAVPVTTLPPVQVPDTPLDAIKVPGQQQQQPNEQIVTSPHIISPPPNPVNTEGVIPATDQKQMPSTAAMVNNNNGNGGGMAVAEREGTTAGAGGGGGVIGHASRQLRFDGVMPGAIMAHNHHHHQATANAVPYSKAAVSSPVPMKSTWMVNAVGKQQQQLQSQQLAAAAGAVTVGATVADNVDQHMDNSTDVDVDVNAMAAGKDTPIRQVQAITSPPSAAPSSGRSQLNLLFPPPGSRIAFLKENEVKQGGSSKKKSLIGTVKMYLDRNNRHGRWQAQVAFEGEEEEGQIWLLKDMLCESKSHLKQAKQWCILEKTQEPLNSPIMLLDANAKKASGASVRPTSRLASAVEAKETKAPSPPQQKQQKKIEAKALPKALPKAPAAVKSKSAATVSKSTTTKQPRELQGLKSKAIILDDDITDQITLGTKLRLKQNNGKMRVVTVVEFTGRKHRVEFSDGTQELVNLSREEYTIQGVKVAASGGKRQQKTEEAKAGKKRSRGAKAEEEEEEEAVPHSKKATPARASKKQKKETTAARPIRGNKTAAVAEEADVDAESSPPLSEQHPTLLPELPLQIPKLGCKTCNHTNGGCTTCRRAALESLKKQRVPKHLLATLGCGASCKRGSIGCNHCWPQLLFRLRAAPTPAASLAPTAALSKPASVVHKSSAPPAQGATTTVQQGGLQQKPEWSPSASGNIHERAAAAPPNDVDEDDDVKSTASVSVSNGAAPARIGSNDENMEAVVVSPLPPAQQQQLQQQGAVSRAAAAVERTPGPPDTTMRATTTMGGGATTTGTRRTGKRSRLQDMIRYTSSMKLDMLNKKRRRRITDGEVTSAKKKPDLSPAMKKKLTGDPAAPSPYTDEYAFDDSDNDDAVAGGSDKGKEHAQDDEGAAVVSDDEDAAIVALAASGKLLSPGDLISEDGNGVASIEPGMNADDDEVSPAEAVADPVVQVEVEVVEVHVEEADVGAASPDDQPTAIADSLMETEQIGEQPIANQAAGNMTPQSKKDVVVDGGGELMRADMDAVKVDIPHPAAATQQQQQQQQQQRITPKASVAGVAPLVAVVPMSPRPAALAQPPPSPRPAALAAPPPPSAVIKGIELTEPPKCGDEILFCTGMHAGPVLCQIMTTRPFHHNDEDRKMKMIMRNVPSQQTLYTRDDDDDEEEDSLVMAMERDRECSVDVIGSGLHWEKIGVTAIPLGPGVAVMELGLTLIQEQHKQDVEQVVGANDWMMVKSAPRAAPPSQEPAAAAARRMERKQSVDSVLVLSREYNTNTNGVHGETNNNSNKVRYQQMKRPRSRTQLHTAGSNGEDASGQQQQATALAGGGSVAFDFGGSPPAPVQLEPMRLNLDQLPPRAPGSLDRRLSSGRKAISLLQNAVATVAAAKVGTVAQQEDASASWRHFAYGGAGGSAVAAKELTPPVAMGTTAQQQQQTGQRLVSPAAQNWAERMLASRPATNNPTINNGKIKNKQQQQPQQQQDPYEELLRKSVGF